MKIFYKASEHVIVGTGEKRKQSFVNHLIAGKGIMSKLVWFSLNTRDHRLITTALELGVDAIVCPEEITPEVKKLSRITVISSNGDLAPGKDVYFERIQSPEDAHRVMELLKHAPVCLEQPDWNIIAVENLVAAGGSLIVEVSSPDDARLALTILEKGVTGILVKTDKEHVLREIVAVAREVTERFNMEEAIVTSVKPVRPGDRVCVDMAMMLGEGEGLLIGDSSSFLFLVHGETLQNPYADPRPFRVNAGGVHAYTRIPGGKTRYLAELKSGDTVLVVSPDGKSREAVVGRVKIERRPLLIVTAEIPLPSREAPLSGNIILQNAETIRLVSPSGEARSVVDLKEGDRVLVTLDTPGRHFGTAVEETIVEK